MTEANGIEPTEEQVGIEAPELPRGIALAWGVAANPQRGPKREMSIERIVETAVGIADADGIGAVSMAAVAKKLGFTSMSLYRYVSAKDDLLLLMQEEATGLPPERGLEAAASPAGADGEVDATGATGLASGDAGGGDPEVAAAGAMPRWRARIEQLYRGQVEIYLRHPWVLALPIEGSPITPNGSAWLDAALGALAETPLTREEGLAVALAVTGQARWFGTVMAGYTNVARTTGESEVEITEREHALFDAVITAVEFPDLRAAIDEGVFLSRSDPFGFSLERLLDGVEAYIEGLDRGAPHRESPVWVPLDDEGVADDKRYRAAVKTTRDAQKAVLAAEKALRQARKAQAQALRDAKARLVR